MFTAQDAQLSFRTKSGAKLQKNLHISKYFCNFAANFKNF